LHTFLKQEWVESGNLAEDFQELGQKILIVLDNASFHKRKDILPQIETEMPNIMLEFLSPYSPDFNLIELVWHSAKKYIAHTALPDVMRYSSSN